VLAEGSRTWMRALSTLKLAEVQLGSLGLRHRFERSD
jgi:hypothetical protein